MTTTIFHIHIKCKDLMFLFLCGIDGCIKTPTVRFPELDSYSVTVYGMAFDPLNLHHQTDQWLCREALSLTQSLQMPSHPTP